MKRSENRVVMQSVSSATRHKVRHWRNAAAVLGLGQYRLLGLCSSRKWLRGEVIKEVG